MGQCITQMAQPHPSPWSLSPHPLNLGRPCDVPWVLECGRSPLLPVGSTSRRPGCRRREEGVPAPLPPCPGCPSSKLQAPPHSEAFPLWRISPEGGVLGRVPGSRGRDGDPSECAVLASAPGNSTGGRGNETSKGRKPSRCRRKGPPNPTACQSLAKGHPRGHSWLSLRSGKAGW